MEIQPVTLRVEPLLKQILEDYRHRLQEREADVELDLDPDLPTVEADRLKLEQVLFNLLDNALSYSRPPRHVAIRARAEGASIVLTVRDNGLGIPNGDLPHIFERFYRVDKGRSRESGGTGLGLSIVKHIVELHGGSVAAKSELGKWTEIIIHLPVTQEDVWTENTPPLADLREAAPAKPAVKKTKAPADSRQTPAST